MGEMKYIIKPRVNRKIFSFYKNVAKKYRHTYDKTNLKRNAHDAIFSIFQIEKTLLRRKPTISQWAGYHMAHKGKWYFAYTIDDDTIFIEDACHAQNMHEEN